MNYTLVTGACGGLGGAFVEELAKQNQPLFLTGRSQARLLRLKEDLAVRYPRLPVQICACDLTNSAERTLLFSFADEQKICFSRLVYVAGVDTQKAFENYPQEKILFQTRVNFEGALSFISSVLQRKGEGIQEILVIGSMSASTPMPYFAIYSATKKAVEYFCVALRTEVKGKAKVTCILPGGIPTRDDIKQNIQEHGFWGRISAKSPQFVARTSLKAVSKNKRTYIPGFWNKFIRFTTKITPLSLQLRFIAKRWKNTEKDAF